MKLNAAGASSYHSWARAAKWVLLLFAFIDLNLSICLHLLSIHIYISSGVAVYFDWHIFYLRLPSKWVRVLIPNFFICSWKQRKTKLNWIWTTIFVNACYRFRRYVYAGLGQLCISDMVYCSFCLFQAREERDPTQLETLLSSKRAELASIISSIENNKVNIVKPMYRNTFVYFTIFFFCFRSPFIWHLFKVRLDELEATLVQQNKSMHHLTT